MHHPSPYIWNVAFCFSGGVFFGRRQFSTLVAKILATMESGAFFVHQVDLGLRAIDEQNIMGAVTFQIRTPDLKTSGCEEISPEIQLKT